MILDEQAIFSDKQAVTASAASTNIVKAKGNIGAGTKIPVLFQVMETFVGATSVTFAIQTADDEAFTSPVTLAQSAAVPVADLKAGYRSTLDIVPLGNKNYMRAYYTVAGTGTAGTITAGICDGRPEGHHN